MNTSPKKNSPVLSVTAGQYHQIRFSQGEKLLWNPAQKRLLQDRPEERVRLRCMEWLHFSCGVGFSRMSTELPVRARMSDEKRRADILAYDKQMRPWILVECKSEDVPINAEAAFQAARYNKTVQAPYLLLTNGRRDALYDMSGSGPVPVNPDVLSQYTTDRFDNSYWVQRGFIGHKDQEKTHFEGLLIKMFKLLKTTVRYIHVNASGLPVPLNHYFYASGSDFLTITAQNDGGTSLAGLLTDSNDNKRILLIPLNENPDSQALILRASGVSRISENHSEKVRGLIKSDPEPDEIIELLNTF